MLYLTSDMTKFSGPPYFWAPHTGHLGHSQTVYWLRKAMVSKQCCKTASYLGFISAFELIFEDSISICGTGECEWNNKEAGNVQQILRKCFTWTFRIYEKINLLLHLTLAMRYAQGSPQKHQLTTTYCGKMHCAISPSALHFSMGFWPGHTVTNCFTIYFRHNN